MAIHTDTTKATREAKKLKAKSNNTTLAGLSLSWPQTRADRRSHLASACFCPSHESQVLQGAQVRMSSSETISGKSYLNRNGNLSFNAFVAPGLTSPVKPGSGCQVAWSVLCDHGSDSKTRPHREAQLETAVWPTPRLHNLAFSRIMHATTIHHRYASTACRT